MKDYPILFCGNLIPGILDGSKTQTRRIIKLPYRNGNSINLNLTRKAIESCGENEFIFSEYDKHGNLICHHPVKNPYIPGRRLWVRETWAEHSLCGLNDQHYEYRADWPTDFNDCMSQRHDYGLIKWRPSIHMTRQASRINLTVKSCRPESRAIA